MTKHSFLKVIFGILGAILMGFLFSASFDNASAQVTKNVVIIMTDDQNVDSLPVMRKLMNFPEGSWVNFTNAVTNDSICCPARASVLTGQYAFITGVINNSSGDKLNDANTLPVWLDNAGYHTGLIGKYLNGFPWNKGANYVPPGWDTFRTTGLGKSDARTTLAIDFINNSSGPFFLYLAFSEPHFPTTPLPQYANANVYIPPDPPNFNESDVSDKPAWVQTLSPLSQTTIDAWHKERVASQRSLLGVDDGIQRIVDALKANGQLENTMIIFMSDHGFSWGSHRHIRKECVYEECIRFPLFIRYPGLPRNQKETRIVSNVDLASTIAEYAGIIPELPQNGKSLIPIITNTAASWNNEAFIEAHGSQARTFDGIRVPGWTYAEYSNGDKELYDLAADPYQLKNKANDLAYQAIQDDLAQRMHDLKLTLPSLTLKSKGVFDGWILESSETSNTGGTMNRAAITFNLGDDVANKQYRAILSFNTSGLPDNAIITKVILKVRKNGVIGGGDPLSMFQGFIVDIKKGLFGTSALELSDFNVSASKTYGPFSSALSGSGWYSMNVTSGKGYVNKTGNTQLRLRFNLDDNNNSLANFLKLYSGNATASDRPQLIIQYYVP